MHAPTKTLRAELSGDDCCTLDNGLMVTGGSPVIGMCRKLVKLGIDPTTALMVYRGTTLAIYIGAIGEAAKLEVNGAGTGFRAQTKTRSQTGPASPMRKSR